MLNPCLLLCHDFYSDSGQTLRHDEIAKRTLITTVINARLLNDPFDYLVMYHLVDTGFLKTNSQTCLRQVSTKT